MEVAYNLGHKMQIKTFRTQQEGVGGREAAGLQAPTGLKAMLGASGNSKPRKPSCCL